MADSLAQNLTKRVFSSIADLTGVSLWSGKTGEPDALGLEVSELLTSEIVIDDSIDYQTLTPKGFYSSVMTTTRKGITNIAPTLDINNEFGEGVITAGNSPTLKALWYSQWFIRNGTPTSFYKDKSILSTGGAVVFSPCYEAVFTLNQKVALNPSVNGSSFVNVAIQYSYDSGIGLLGRSNGFVSITAVSGAETTVSAGAYGSFYISADGTEFGFKAGLASTYKLACTVTGITE